MEIEPISPRKKGTKRKRGPNSKEAFHECINNCCRRYPKPCEELRTEEEQHLLIAPPGMGMMTLEEYKKLARKKARYGGRPRVTGRGKDPYGVRGLHDYRDLCLPTPQNARIGELRTLAEFLGLPRVKSRGAVSLCRGIRAKVLKR